jgi:hypothetical protein
MAKKSKAKGRVQGRPGREGSPKAREEAKALKRDREIALAAFEDLAWRQAEDLGMTDKDQVIPEPGIAVSAEEIAKESGLPLERVLELFQGCDED